MEKEQIVYKKVSELKLNEKNPRKNDNAVEMVANSIKQYGFRTPIIIDNKNVVWCGNTRLKASRMLGMEEVPCIIVKDLTQKQIRELALLDNKLNEVAEWDYNLLSLELEDLNFEGFENLDWGTNNIEDDDYGTDFNLRSGGKNPLTTMSITFSDEQAETINEAIKQMKASDTFKNYKDEYNENGNGNALYLVVLEWLSQKI